LGGGRPTRIYQRQQKSTPTKIDQHLVVAISAAIVRADADTVANKARRLSCMVSTGMAA
jgi:hypothetical protein